MARLSACTRTRFAKPAARRRECACCASTMTIPWPPPPCCRKKTKKKRSRPPRLISSGTAAEAFLVTRSKEKSAGLEDSPCATLLAMKITRRRLVVSGFFIAFALVAFTTGVSNLAATHSYLAFVGTYTNKTESKGSYAFQFDVDTGKLSEKGVAAPSSDPSWVAIHPNGKFAYAANEAGKQSTITAFAIDANNAKLTQLNQVPAQGEDPCHLSFDKTGKYLFAANYSSGTVAVFPIQADGKLGEHTAVVKNAGELGPKKKRQEGPHAHWVEATPNNKFVLVADLGLA